MNALSGCNLHFSSYDAETRSYLAEGGTMLQKIIRWKTGSSRVKTHRVLYRLDERGVVTAEKHCNTNKITLAEWLMT